MLNIQSINIYGYIVTIKSWSRHDCIKCISGIPITFWVTVESKKFTFKLHVHNTARSMLDVNRSGYRAQIVSTGVQILATV